jgi:cobalt-zinc-cadmium efflux system outer membrane protein
MKRVVLGILFLGIASTAFAQTAPQTLPLSLDRAVELFLARNVEVQAARYQVDRAKAERIAAKVRPNPVVAVTAENLALNGPLPFRGLYEVGASYTETIELGGKRRSRENVAELSITAAEAQFEDVLRTKIGALKRSYYEAVLARYNLDIAREDRTTLDDLLRVNSDRFQAGAIAEGELLKVRLERTRFDAAIRQAELHLSHAMIELLEKLEEPDFGVRPLAADLEAPSLLSLNLEALKQQALRNRPDLKASDREIALAAGKLQLEQARAVPDISPFVGYKRVADNNTVMVGVSIPLRRHKNEGGIARATADETLAKGKREVVENQVRVEVETAFRSYEASRDQVLMFRDQLLRQADESQTIALSAYREGAVDLASVLEAQRTRSGIKQQYYNTLFDYQASLLELELAIGGEVRP